MGGNKGIEYMKIINWNTKVFIHNRFAYYSKEVEE